MLSSPVRWLAPGGCALLIAACSVTTFDDYEAKAPAVKIQQEGDRSSAVFGVHLAAMPRRQVGKLLTGGLVLVSGNVPVALNTGTFSVDGKFTNTEADNDAFLRLLGEPDQITALAPAPSEEPPKEHGGPFAYVGKARKGVGSLMIMDVNSFDMARELSAPEGLQGFASAVTATDLSGDGARRHDLAIGATSGVMLLRSSGWPNFGDISEALVVRGGAVPANAAITVLTSGQLIAGAGDAVAAAAPLSNFVGVLHHLGDVGTPQCVDLCAGVLEIPLPDDAVDFGTALLFADLSGDGKPELLVGAPGTPGGGAVYVYDLTAEHLDGAKEPPAPRVLQPPAGAERFGAGLAFGRFDGREPLLAVGAPGTAIDGKEKAGAIFLYGAQLGEPTGMVRLARPEVKGQLGGVLTSMPFKNDERVNDVLVGSGATAAYVFFASITPEHEDFRAR